MTIELFYSPMCLHCPQAKKILTEVAEEFGEKIRVEEINVLSSNGLERAQGYGVKEVPAIIVNGKAKIVGVPTRERLGKIIQRELKSIELS